MNVVWFEFLLSLRRLRRRPAPTLLTLGTFTLSLTLALLSWSLYYTVFRYNPDFDPAGRLYVVGYQGSLAGGSGNSTYEEFNALRDGQTVFSEFAEVSYYLSTFTDTPAGMQRLLGAGMSSGAFRMLGAKPSLGRLFLPEDDALNGPKTAMLSDHIWKAYFGGNPAVVGHVIQVSGNSVTIVGIMPASFRFPNDQDLWLSMSLFGNNPNYPRRDGIARLKPGITPERAERDLQLILSRLGPASPANRHHLRPAVTSFRDYYLGPDIRVSALVLFALSLLFVIVSCVNAANLALIDFLGRRAETATSLALGIPRRAAIRCLCFQIGIVAAGAMVASLGLLIVFAPLLHREITAINPPYWLKFSVGLQHVGMAAVLAVISAGVALIAPLAYLLCVRPDDVIRENLSASRGSGRARSRRLLLTLQMAVLTVLGISAGLLVRSNLGLNASQWNYDARRVFRGSLSMQGMNGWLNMDDPHRYAAFHRVLDGIQRQPGITGAALMQGTTPGFDETANLSYALDPDGFTQDRPLGHALTAAVTDQVFATLGVPLVAGSTLPQTLPPSGWDYAVINESLAERLWPRTDPLHRALYVRYDGADPKAPPGRLLVVGVARDFQASGPAAPVNDYIYTPLQNMVGVNSTQFLLASGPTVPTVGEMTRAVHSIDPSMSLFFTSTIGATIDVVLSPVHLTTRLTLLFAAAAVLLCSIGLYSLTVSQVLQSSREFGIRMALGGEPQALWRRFVGGHLLNALAGIALGLAGAFYAAGFLRILLFGISEHNTAIFLGVPLLILGVSAAACLPSLFRLRRINPADCLRSL